MGKIFQLKSQLCRELNSDPNLIQIHFHTDFERRNEILGGRNEVEIIHFFIVW